MFLISMYPCFVRSVIVKVHFADGCVTRNVTILFRLVGQNENSPVITIGGQQCLLNSG